jgi:carboxymethylenebutenolidase
LALWFSIRNVLPFRVHLAAESAGGSVSRGLIPMTQKKSELPTQNTVPHYLAQPKSGKGKGVLVLHAWWGLNPFFKDFCERLAKEDLIVLAPDLYRGATAPTVDEAKKLRSKLKKESVTQEIVAAAEHLRALCGARKRGIGVVRFSLGGYWALWLAEQKANLVAATVAFYATRTGDYAKSQSAFQFHHADSDDYVAASGVRQPEKNLHAAGKDAEFYSYPGTTHWFFESDRANVYNASAARLAWKRTIAFLKKHT